MRLPLLAAAAAAALLPFAAARAQALRPDQQAYRALYKELVETNTTLSSGSCVMAEERMAARLRAAGYGDGDITMVPALGKPKEGSMVVQLKGSDAGAKAILLLAHVDVVEAKREDWVRDPFVLNEEGGVFYARGSLDDKAQASMWVDTLIRLKAEGFRPRRTIKMALTCGEETNGAFNGAQDLSTNHKALIDAEFALNEGGGGLMTKDGKKLINGVQAAEKTSQNFTLTVTNPGGHSSRPTPDNAIYQLSEALLKISRHSFPVQQTEITRGMAESEGRLTGGELGAAMIAFSKNANDPAAIARMKVDPSSNTLLYTTCITTLVSAGHATNALPQRATANVNCRMWPGATKEEVSAELARTIGDPGVKITVPEVRGPAAKPSPLSANVMGPLKAVSQKHFPGVPVVPAMSAGATDGQFMGNAGIPTYGVSGLFMTNENAGAHGLNEHVPVRSLYESRDFLYDLVKAYAGS